MKGVSGWVFCDCSEILSGSANTLFSVTSKTLSLVIHSAYFCFKVLALETMGHADGGMNRGSTSSLLGRVVSL